ncbi:hypothetical protein DRV85_16720 [Rhodosalinus halophilus]|jgi:hypothetical protein|uniref:Uncharacterized protein n=1 Tax=Rhodosalinus halophilus TaxID=2259333 RepID=A0A365U4W9_9RHOB|nr:hypothetical protein [Rhodosalinus halophilus]RBI83243.1 hypothetical protein DRV85_16720 [Rhodosalinus halophilus]
MAAAWEGEFMEGSTRNWIIGGVAVLVLAALGWFFFMGGDEAGTATAPAAEDGGTATTTD